MSRTYIAPLLAHDEAAVIKSALHAYLSETKHYLRSSGYEPCAPECPHCRPRVEHFAEVTRGLQQRANTICRALDVIDAATVKAAST